MGSVTLAEALAKADSDDVIGNMRVLAMLEALPGVGKVKARRLMADIEIAENRKVRGLGPKQRIALLEQLG
jgi:ribosomal protein S13